MIPRKDQKVIGYAPPIRTVRRVAQETMTRPRAVQKIKLSPPPENRVPRRLLTLSPKRKKARKIKRKKARPILWVLKSFWGKF